MKSIKPIIFFACIAFFTLATSAQENPVHKLGLHGGMTSGFGISYKFEQEGFGIQAVVLPHLYRNENELLRPSSIGISLFYSFFQRRVIDIFAYTSIGHFGTPEIAPFFNAGLGAGIEFHIAERLNLNMQYGIGYFLMNVDPFFFPTAEFGIHFRLNKLDSE